MRRPRLSRVLGAACALLSLAAIVLAAVHPGPLSLLLVAGAAAAGVGWARTTPLTREGDEPGGGAR